MNYGFKILDADGKAISIADLDKEVSEITGNPQEARRYTDLTIRKPDETNWQYISRSANWYDTIGWMIASENKSFEDIIEYYTEPMRKYLGKPYEDGTICTIESIYPGHMAVLNTWISKGYKPVRVELS